MAGRNLSGDTRDPRRASLYESHIGARNFRGAGSEERWSFLNTERHFVSRFSDELLTILGLVAEANDWLDFKGPSTAFVIFCDFIRNYHFSFFLQIGNVFEIKFWGNVEDEKGSFIFLLVGK